MLNPSHSALTRSALLLLTLALGLARPESADAAALGLKIGNPAIAPSSGQDRDPLLRDARRWKTRFEDVGHKRPDDLKEEFDKLLVKIQGVFDAQPERRIGSARALLQLCDLTPSSSFLARTSGGKACRMLAGFVSQEPTVESWLTQSLASNAKATTASMKERVAMARALGVLRGRAQPGYLVGPRARSIRLALFSACNSKHTDLRNAALQALTAYQAPLAQPKGSKTAERAQAEATVATVLARQLELWSQDANWIDPDPILDYIKKHRFRNDRQSSNTNSILKRAFQPILMDSDWRKALDGLEFFKSMEASWTYEVLIDALEDWQRRRLKGEGRYRVEGDIADELERRTGKRLGTHPQRWRTWWNAVGRDQVAVDEAARDANPNKKAEFVDSEQDPASGGKAAKSKPKQTAQRTVASFFGLRPRTDSVVFVIDRSGSMAAAHGPASQVRGSKPATSASRYGEAVRQMLAFAGSLPEGSRFRVILFSDSVRSRNGSLVSIDESSLKSAKGWLMANRPDGGTLLQPAIRKALKLRGVPKGVGNGPAPPKKPTFDPADLLDLDADTVIVLCDGANQDGTGWIPELTKHASAAHVRFHGVQIGGGGSGSLQMLAEQTGGQFVTVQ